jgi:hypothetical protein
MREATTISDPSVRKELQDIPALFWTLVPEDAINLGYDFYLEKALHRDDPAQQRIVALIEDKYKIFRLFDDWPRAARYVNALIDAAITYKRGLDRTAKNYDQAKAFAMEKKDAVRRNRILTATKDGLVRGGVRLLIVGLTVFSAVLTLLHLDVIRLERLEQGGGTHTVAALAVAGLVTLVTIYLEISKLDRLERDLLLNYELALIRARIAHAESRMRELRNAYGMIRRDYCTLLNQPAPDEQQALTHLLALVQHDLQQDRQELNKVERQLQQSTLRRLLRMLGIGGNKVADCAEDHEATVAADLD